MKKFIALSLAVIFAAVLLAGCTPTGTTPLQASPRLQPLYASLAAGRHNRIAGHPPRVPDTARPILNGLSIQHRAELRPLTQADLSALFRAAPACSAGEIFKMIWTF